MKQIIIRLALTFAGCLMASLPATGVQPVTVKSLGAASFLAAETTPATNAIPEVVTVQPYLKNPSGEGMTICVLSKGAEKVRILWSPEGRASQKEVDAKGATIPGVAWVVWKARLGRLKPGTAYQYQVRYDAAGAGQATPVYHFRTLDPKAKTVSFIAFNDLHHHDKTLAALMQYVKPGDYEFSLLMGDCLEGHPDAAELFRACLAYLPMLNAPEKPVLFVRGNHDTRQAFAKKLAYLFDLPNLSTSQAWGNDEWQYTLRAGPIWFLAMDTGEDDDSSTPLNSYKNPALWRKVRQREAEWLKKVVTRKDWRGAPWRVYVSHIPLYNNNPWWCRDGLPRWESLLRDVNPDLMLAGHDHGWKLLPRKEGGSPPWPVLIGGGPSLNEGTVMLITADEASLKARLVAARDGQLLKEFDAKK